jgi:hypothetical protein
MTYARTIAQKPTSLHAIVTGRNSREHVMQYLEDILQECKARQCFRVLIEERLEGRRLGTLDVFKIVSGGSSRAPGMFEAIAYVDVNAAGDLMQFAETVAVNRAVPLTVFSTVADAEQWLRGRGPCERPCGEKSIEERAIRHGWPSHAGRYESGHQGTEATGQNAVGHSVRGFTVRQ